MEVIKMNSRTGLLSLALEWGMIHKEELLANWQRCRDKVAPAKIEPPL
jgi:hypothetical protein